MDLNTGVDVHVRFEWRMCGQITLDNNDQLRFPSPKDLPEMSCVYRFVGRRPHQFPESWDQPSQWWVYVGQTVNLRRRLAAYRKPGPHQRTNQRVNKALRMELTQGGDITLFTATEVKIKDGAKWNSLPMYGATHRILAESAAIVQAYRTENLYNVDFLNKGTDDAIDREFGDEPWT